MNTLKSRLELALQQREGATKAGLARAAGVTKPAVSAWFSGAAKKIGGEALLLSARYLGVRPEWLATGRGPMSLNGADGNTSHIASATGGVADSPDTFDLDAKVHTRRLPRIRWEQVGELKNMLLESLTPISHDESPFDSGPGSFLLELASESMLPDYRPGEVIQVDPSIASRHGDDVIVLLPSGRAIFRRLVDSEDGQLLQALNPQWPDRLAAMPESARVVGVVVGSWMTRRK